MTHFPFEDGVPGWIGQELTIAKNLQPSPVMRPFERVVLDTSGKVNGSEKLQSWKVNNGVLELLDGKSNILYEFNGAEIRNGTMYAVGESLLEASFNGFARCAIYPFRPITELRFKIAISSHRDYCEHTLPRLLRSLERVGYIEDDIEVVVGGCREPMTIKGEVPDYHWVDSRKMGWTAASVIAGNKDVDYWLLLHDTCEATEDFSRLLESVDVGIGYDMIRLANDKRHDMGFFSAEFLGRYSDLLQSSRPDKIGHQLISQARLLSVLNGDSNTGASRLRDKNVYGCETDRRVLLYSDIGIKKYAGKVATGGKP